MKEKVKKDYNAVLVLIVILSLLI